MVSYRGTQRNGPIGGGSGSSNGSQSNKRKAQKSANAVVKNAKTTIADAGRNLIATLFGGGQVEEEEHSLNQLKL